jgi:hypothetical protein
VTDPRIDRNELIDTPACGPLPRLERYCSAVFGLKSHLPMRAIGARDFRSPRICVVVMPGRIDRCCDAFA